MSLLDNSLKNYSTANYQPALSPPTPRTLIADDQTDVIAALRLLLKSEGYQTEGVTSPGAAIDAIKHRNFDLALIDLNYARDTTSGREGLDLLASIRSIDKTLPIVVMTAWGNIELAVEAIRRGGADFIQKPWENAHLLEVVRKQLESGRELRRKVQLERVREDARVRELADAREIQRHLLPRAIPQICGCDISAIWHPVREVSGDYFDVLKFDEQTTGICIADVMGKGMPAALLMSNLQAVLRVYASANTSPAELCDRINRLVCTNVDAGKFITCFYGLVDMESRRLTYTNAGHYPPLLVHRDGSLTRLTEGGIVFGLSEDCKFEIGEVELKSGDRLVLFTDGLTEARNSFDEEFGEERLLDILRTCPGLDGNKLQQMILQKVNDFCLGDLSDDTTMVVLTVE
jgi:sigma-B regulation protein RsbU (phosphoserine phosphatase)